MNTFPMFSICVPVYNTSLYLAQCLRSILYQTDQDFEIILVDDGSTDNSGEICDLFAQKYPDKIFVIHQRNKGLFVTRSVAFRAAKGKIAICVDSDDCLRNDALALIRQKYSETNADVIFYEWSRNSNFVSRCNRLGFDDSSTVLKKEDVLNILFSSRNINNMWIHSISGNALNRVKSYVPDVTLQYGEDLYWNLMIYDSSSFFAYLPEKLYYYRPNKFSITHTFDKTRINDILFVREQLSNFAHTYLSKKDINILKGISCVNIMQVLDVAEMILFSDEKYLIDDLYSSDLYVNSSKDVSGVTMGSLQYRIKFFLFKKRLFLLYKIFCCCIRVLLPVRDFLRG